MNQRNDHQRPENRAQHCMTSVREYIIIYGGYENFSGAECNELWSYNTVNGVWKQHIPPIEIKDTCVSSSICSVGNKVYIFGGIYFGDNFRQTNSLVSFNLTDYTWEVLSSHTDDYDPDTPPPMFGNLLLYYNGSLYILGGFHDNFNLDTMHKFCLKTSTWSLVPQKGVKPTFHHQVYGTIYKNQIYCFEDPLNGQNKFRDIRIFDFYTHKWISKATKSKNQYPGDRYYESFAFSGNVGFLGGGIKPYSNIYYSDIWRIDLETLEWFKLEDFLTKGMCDHRMSVVDDNYLYCFGGFHTDNFLSMFERFTVQPLTLYRLCLKSIRHSMIIRNDTKDLPAAIVDELILND